MSPAELARVLRAAADEAEAIAREQATERRDWVDQSQSPLGSRRHCRAVRQRIAEGRAGASILGRRHLLSPTALAETMGEGTKPKAKPATYADALRSDLRLVGGRG